jgi:glucose-1-phosphate thymidylyltransferase
MTNFWTPDDLIGIIPAAGKATRIAPLPGSKELFPVGFTETVMENKPRRYPKVVSQYLLENMIAAGARRIFFVLSDGKWDIPRYYGDGRRLGASLAYLIVEQMVGMPYTINMAYPWVRGATVVFGMPDTIFTPADAYTQLLERHFSSGADLTLGLFHTGQPWRFGMVDFDPHGRVLQCIDKPAQTKLQYLWGNACWGPRFTELLNQRLEAILTGPVLQREVVLGDFFQVAIEDGLNVQSVAFDDGQYVDIGSPQELEDTARRFISRDA